MKSKELTTEYLLKLENVGAVLTSGNIPYGLSTCSTTSDWCAMFPKVSKELIEAWSDYARSKTILENTISILNSQK